MINSISLSDKEIENKIYLVRGQKVMIDSDLSDLYEIDTKRLNQQVKRNIDRFPPDFMFQLTEKECENLRSHFATSSLWGGRRTLPYVFTEHGVLMLSSVLNSPRAIQVNIQIMRIYVRIRELFALNKDVLHKLEQIERNVTRHDEEIQLVFRHLKQLLQTPVPPRKKISYKTAAAN